MIPYYKSKINFCQKLPSETYHSVFLRFFKIKISFQDKNFIASKTYFSETYLLKLTIMNFLRQDKPYISQIVQVS